MTDNLVYVIGLYEDIDILEHVFKSGSFWGESIERASYEVGKKLVDISLENPRAFIVFKTEIADVPVGSYYDGRMMKIMKSRYRLSDTLYITQALPDYASMPAFVLTSTALQEIWYRIKRMFRK